MKRTEVVKVNMKVLKKYGKNFCSAPFTSLYEGENGIITTCCKSRKSLGNTETDNYEDVVNSEYLKDLRLKFLRGERPDHCLNCWHIEEITNKISGPREYNNFLGKKNLTQVANEMLPDGTITEQKPAWLDLLSSNKCNFACVGCKPHLSSTIAKKFNEEFSILHEKDSYKDFNKEWTNNINPRLDYILKYGDSIKMIHLNGGEPFMSEDTYDLLDAMMNAGLHKKITLWSHTNGSILTNYKGKDLVNDYFSKWKDARITMSLDGVGKVGSFIRYGYTDEKWQSVLSKIQEQKHIEINVHGCLNIFNVFHLEEWGATVHKLLNGYNRAHLGMWSDNSVNFKMLGICEDTKKRAVQLIEKLLSKDDLLPIRWYTELNFYKKSIEEAGRPATSHIRAFVKGVEALDQKRNIKFKDACPELIPLMNKAKTLI